MQGLSDRQYRMRSHLFFPYPMEDHKFLGVSRRDYNSNKVDYVHPHMHD
jgi:hypothetical protein